MEPVATNASNVAAAVPSASPAESPMRKPQVTLNRNPNASNNNDEEMFSPTSAAALALSTLHHFGAGPERPSAAALKGTRLFNKDRDSGSEAARAAEKGEETTYYDNDNALVSTHTNESEEENIASKSGQAATFAPPGNNCNDGGINGSRPYPLASRAVYSYPTMSPPMGQASHYAPTHHHQHSHLPPPPHHHNHSPAFPFGPDHRFSPWSLPLPLHTGVGDSTSSSQSVSVASPWAGLPFTYPQPPPPTSTSTYSTDGQHPGSRGSTPTLVGPSPPSCRSGSSGTEVTYYHPGHVPRSSPLAVPLTLPRRGQAGEESNPPLLHDKPYSRAQSETTLVTPTPKKAKLAHPESAASTTSVSSAASNKSTYSRKNKSLGILADNFLKAYQELPRGATIIVDEAAVKLGVERRRIYDVVNILEAICLLCKKHKNTYTWLGTDHLDAVFGRLQAAAMEEYPDDAQRFLGAKDVNPELTQGSIGRKSQARGRDFKSLAKLSQEFLQVFLVGHLTLSLPEASDKIQGTTTMEELVAMGQKKYSEEKPSASAFGQKDPEKERKAAAARGLKTKIRRLYDIANVFLSVGFLKKVDSNDSTRRPNFSWAYRLSPREIYNLHRPSNNVDMMKTSDMLLPSMMDPSSSQQLGHAENSRNSPHVILDQNGIPVSVSSSPCSSTSSNLVNATPTAV